MDASNTVSPRRILVVDDNLMDQQLMRLVLSELGYETRFAACAEEVPELLLSWRPELILTDVNLPGQDGLELTRRLKADTATKDIRILVVTAYGTPRRKQLAAEAGCDGYITKPVDTRTLPKLIARCLAARKERRQ